MAPATAQATTYRHIETTPGVRGGKPRISGTRITVADVAILHRRLGQSLEEIAGDYELPLAAVFAAMAYYHDHREEIDRSIEDEKALGERLRQSNPSPLQEKLAALSRG